MNITKLVKECKFVVIIFNKCIKISNYFIQLTLSSCRKNAYSEEVNMTISQVSLSTNFKGLNQTNYSNNRNYQTNLLKSPGKADSVHFGSKAESAVSVSMLLTELFAGIKPGDVKIVSNLNEHAPAFEKLQIALSQIPNRIGTPRLRAFTPTVLGEDAEAYRSGDKSFAIISNIKRSESGAREKQVGGNTNTYLATSDEKGRIVAIGDPYGRILHIDIAK